MSLRCVGRDLASNDVGKTTAYLKEMHDIESLHNDLNYLWARRRLC